MKSPMRRPRNADAMMPAAASTAATSTSSLPFPLFPPGPSTGDGDTIVALATSPAPSAVAVVRVSGPLALRLVSRLFRPGNGKEWRARSHSVSYGVLFSSPGKDGTEAGEVIDEVLVITMRGPRSYTREHVVEVHAHGGPTCAPRVLEALLSAGESSAFDDGFDGDGGGGLVRLARPGEFTLRAFLSGRLSLDQAEAVADVVSARSPAAADAALAGLGLSPGGGASSSSSSTSPPLSLSAGAAASRARAACLSLLARVEASLDYGDDNDGVPELADEASEVAEIDAIRAGIDAALSTRALGVAMRRGVSVALVGAPNVGKSSLLNALCGHERAIVSSVPGTTRDVVDAPGLLPGGVPVTLLDTAGVRDAVKAAEASSFGSSSSSSSSSFSLDAARIEALGVARAAEAAAGADVVALVFDASKGWTREDEEALAGVRQALSSARKTAGSSSSSAPPAVLVANKRDVRVVEGGGAGPPSLPSSLALGGPTFASVVSVSAVTREGLPELGSALAAAVGLPTVPPGGHAALVNARQAEALTRASRALQRAADDATAGATPDCWSVGLREAVAALGEVGGAGVREEVLDAVFSQFCIGK